MLATVRSARLRDRRMSATGIARMSARTMTIRVNPTVSASPARSAPPYSRRTLRLSSSIWAAAYFPLFPVFQPISLHPADAGRREESGGGGEMETRSIEGEVSQIAVAQAVLLE